MSTSDRSLPRVLVISSHVFNSFTGGGIALTNYFRGWPKDRLMEVYSDNIMPDRSVCDRFYELGPEEIRWFWPLSLAYRRQYRYRLDEPIAPSGPGGPSSRSSFRALFHGAARLLGGKALFYRIRLSDRLRADIAAFRPDIIFTQLGDLALMDLLWQVAREFRVPISLQIPDNWIDSDYRRGILAPLLRRRLLRMTSKIVRSAALRFGISDMMGADYRRRWGVPFETLLNPIDSQTWGRHARTSWSRGSEFTLGYVGTMSRLAQVDSLRDIAASVGRLRARGLKARLTVYTTPADAAAFGPDIRVGDQVTIEESPPSADLPPLLARLDVLLIPVNFDRKSLRYIRFSMPGKIPAYMCSATPILVYGPAEAAPVDYARRDGWAEVVDHRSPERLDSTIQRLAEDESLRERLGRRSQELALTRHDGEPTRARFRELMSQAARQGAPAS